VKEHLSFCTGGQRMNSYQYFKTDSKGDPVFRKDTDQTLREVEIYLKESDITYEYRLGATALKIYNEQDKPYIYYFTTGRWKPYNGKRAPHYHSDSIQDFVKKYLNRKFDDNRS